MDKEFNLHDYIIYEDGNILVFNKPRGVLVQSDGSDTKSLDLMVKNYLPSSYNGGPAHRIDRDTSGIVVFGKNNKALAYLNELFQDHNLIQKQYITLVNGITDEEGVIEAPLRKSFEKHKMVVAPLKSGAKPAKTLYKVKKHFKNYTLLDVTLLTGRTHQIRAHMSYIRHHVVGDIKYGDYKINNLFESQYGFKNQFLHSYKIAFGELKKPLDYLSNKEFVADLPNELDALLKQLD